MEHTIIPGASRRTTNCCGAERSSMDRHGVGRGTFNLHFLINSSYLFIIYWDSFYHYIILSFFYLTGSKLSKNAFSRALENIIDVDVYHTSDSCSLSHQSKFLNISSKLTNNVTDAKIGLQEMKRNSPDRLILGHVNINSIRNKFDALTYIIGNNIDIILISETKIDDAFPTAQIFIKGFSAPYRQERNRTGGGLLLFVREDVPSRILNPKSETDIETLSVKINFRKRRWFLNCSYNWRFQ